jgi:hypothetical protein
MGRSFRALSGTTLRRAPPWATTRTSSHFVLLCMLSCADRLVDETGQPMGPYRVWLEYAWLPGLAMSRALGDRLAHS